MWEYQRPDGGTGNLPNPGTGGDDDCFAVLRDLCIQLGQLSVFKYI